VHRLLRRHPRGTAAPRPLEPGTNPYPSVWRSASSWAVLLANCAALPLRNASRSSDRARPSNVTWKPRRVSVLVPRPSAR
jgi:hypothetical protein